MQKKYLYFLAAAHLCNDISSGALPAILPFFVSNYGMDYTAIAGLMFASSFLSSFIQPVFGWLADRSSKLWFMGFGVMVTGLSLSLTGFLTSYWAIFAAVTCMGIGSAIFHPEAARLVNAISGHQRGSAMSIFSVGGNGGFGFGPLLAVAVISIFGMRGTALFGLIGLAMGLALFWLVPQIKKAAEASMPPEELSSASGAVNVQPAGENDWPAFLRLTLVIVFRSVAFCGLSSFLPMFCVQALGTSNAMGSTTLSVLSMAGIFTTLLGGWLADRWGYVTVLRRGSWLLVPLLALVIFAGDIRVIYALLLPMSVAMHGPYSSFVVLGQSYLAKSIGFASGVTLGLSFSVGGIVVPSLGWFADSYGIQSVMVLLVVVALLSALATLLLPQPKAQGAGLKGV